MSKNLNIELTVEELLFIKAIIGRLNMDSAIKILNVEGDYRYDRLVDFLNNQKNNRTWVGYDAYTKLTKTCEEANLSLESLSKGIFNFKNGLNAELISNQLIKIGCRAYRYNEITNIIGAVFEYADKATIEGHTFTKEESERFSQWLKENKDK